MLPGMIPTTEARLRELLVPSVTEVNEETLAGIDVTLMDASDDEARALGIDWQGGPEVTIVVTDPTRRLGTVPLQPGGRQNTLFFDNRGWGASFYANIRLAGDDSIVLFNRIGNSYVALPEVLLRSDRQFLFWGLGSSAVGCNLEIEGTDTAWWWATTRLFRPACGCATTTCTPCTTWAPARASTARRSTWCWSGTCGSARTRC